MSDITLPLDGVIQNPTNHRHLMVIKPIARRIRIFVGQDMIAETTSALRVLEIGAAFYDPTIYVPKQALTQDLEQQDKSTHCPIKGDAEYFTYKGDEISWAYPAPLDIADKLSGFHAFWPDKVRIEEGI